MSIRPSARVAVTLRQLAASAGVHPSTISRVANGDPHLRVATETRERIERLLKDTGYRPNGIARSLKTRLSFVLGVVIPDVTNPFFAAMYRGVEDASLPRGYNVILCNTDNSRERERSQMRMLSERRVDGLVLASAHLRDASIRALRREGVAHVLVNRFSDEAEDTFVGGDDSAGARLATRHLIELGHRRIGHLSGPGSVSTSAGRLAGFNEALAAAGLDSTPELVVEGGYSEEGGRRAAHQLLQLPPDRRPTALFAANDLAAVGVYEAARSLHLAIPGDLAVVGYNDIPLAARLDPPLTTIQVPIHQMGLVAAGLLIDAIEGRPSQQRRILFAPQLVVRASTIALTPSGSDC